MSCSNDRATIGSYIILLLQSSSGNIPSHSWPNQSSDMAKFSSRGDLSREFGGKNLRQLLKSCMWLVKRYTLRHPVDGWYAICRVNEESYCFCFTHCMYCTSSTLLTARQTKAQLLLGEADRTSRYLLLVYCLSPYACHIHLVVYLLSNPDPWENGSHSQRRYDMKNHRIALSYLYS